LKWRPLEPDPVNSGVGNGRQLDPYSIQGCGFFVFWAMKILLNGEQYETKASSVKDLLAELEIEPARVAVELNLKIIRKDAFDENRISEGDQVEIVNFVGGGAIKNRE